MAEHREESKVPVPDKGLEPVPQRVVVVSERSMWPPGSRVTVVGPPMGVERGPGPQPFPHQLRWLREASERERQKKFPAAVEAGKATTPAAPARTVPAR